MNNEFIDTMMDKVMGQLELRMGKGERMRKEGKIEN